MSCFMKDDVREIQMELLPPAPDQKDEFARVLAYILDDLIPIPGTKYRVGLDPIIGLIPGLGDTSTAAVSSLILVHGLRAGVPRVVLVRMAINILINSILGALPGLGDLFSAWFKSNQRNYLLLRRHSAGALCFHGLRLGFPDSAARGRVGGCGDHGSRDRLHGIPDDFRALRLGVNALSAHLRALALCARCPAMHKPVVVGRPVASRILLVGQAPGIKEPQLGRPFAWTAGRTLFRWLESALGWDEETARSKIYFAAVCRCFPGKEPGAKTVFRAKRKLGNALIG